MSGVYNINMGAVDTDNFMGFHDYTSWGRGVKSKKWWYVSLWDLLDKVKVGCYCRMRERHNDANFKHGRDFYENLTSQLYNIAAGMEYLNEEFEAFSISSVDMLTKTQTPSFGNDPYDSHSSSDEGFDRRAAAMADSEHVVGQLIRRAENAAGQRVRRSCWLCMQLGRGKTGAERLEDHRRGRMRINYPQTS